MRQHSDGLTPEGAPWHALCMESTVRKTVLAVIVSALAVMPASAQTQQLPDGLYAEIKTERGTILCFLEYQKAPMTVANFVGLAEGTLKANGVAGHKFYDGLTFHRVEKGFVIQGGDPKGDGTGGPGYEFPNETRGDLKHDAPGVMAMANSGPDTNGSQFYITMSAAAWLDGGYSVFGHVVQGMDVVNAIAVGDHMQSVRILRIGSAAAAFVVTQKSFDAMVANATAAIAERGKTSRLAALAQIKKQWPSLTTTQSGLMYEVMKKGSGASPTSTSTVTLNYKGMLLDGTLFADTSAQGGSAQVVTLQKVSIKGWVEALLTMKRGEKRRLIVPPELAFGSRGYANLVPGGAWVVFEIELVDFK
jgi:peptidyl-prolyl cis-trans isomerase A (cyclophilin A)